MLAARPGAGGPAPLHAMSEAEIDAALDAVRRRSLGSTGAIASSPAASIGAPPKPFDYAPIYFPGTPTLTQASTITVRAGQEHTGLDFALQRVPTAAVAGVVSRPDGERAAGATLQMTAITPPGPFATDTPLVLNATAGPDGQFRIPR